MASNGTLLVAVQILNEKNLMENDKTNTSTKEQNGALLQAGVITRFLGLDRPYSLYSVLDKLIETSDILMHEKNYDGHGWEVLREARQEAVYYKTQIEDYLRQQNEL